MIPQQMRLKPTKQGQKRTGFYFILSFFCVIEPMLFHHFYFKLFLSLKVAPALLQNPPQALALRNKIPECHHISVAAKTQPVSAVPHLLL